ncbi:3145_t:CDS:2, partial [Acaulospora morrowiae]
MLGLALKWPRIRVLVHFILKHFPDKNHRKCTEWNITEFLNESKEETFQLKIGLYLKSLETINDYEQGKRQERAKLLLNDYREA